MVAALVAALLALPGGAGAAASVTFTKVTTTPIPLGRYFDFTAEVNDTGSTDIIFDITSPSGQTVDFQGWTNNIAAGASYTRTRWVSSAEFFNDLGTFTVRAKLDGVPVAMTSFTVVAPDIVVPTFADVTAARGISGTIPMGSVPCEMTDGAAWADIDGDGDLDLFIPSLDPVAAPERLWINDGTGHFTDQAAARGISDPTAKGMGASFADYDNDGDPDLYVTENGPNRLYRNDGGNFTEVGAAAGVADPLMTQSAAWGDYDEDGFLDLFSVNYAACNGPGDGFPGDYQADKLYHNNGDGTFSDVSSILPATSPLGAGFQAAWFDYDNDGDDDLYVANDYLTGQPVTPDANRLFRNDGPQGGSWTFTDVTTAAKAALKVNSMGIGLGDYDRDLDYDMVVSNVGPDVLARNMGNGTFKGFENKARVAKRNALPNNWTWGLVFTDINNDGWEDIYIARSVMMLDSPRANHVFVNGKDQTFLDLSSPSGANDSGGGRGVAPADFNQDGKVDILLVNKNGSPILFENTTPTANNWLEVDTVGTASNRDGCGARLVLNTASGSQLRGVFCGSTSLGSGVDTTVHFGLGSDTAINSLTITWPSGAQQVVTNPAINQRLTVTEPAA